MPSRQPESSTAGRPTIAVKDAAVQLGCTTSYVHKLLDQENEPLQGPAPPGRGRHRVRWVYVDTLESQLRRQRSRPGRGRRDKEQANTVIERRLQDLADQVAALKLRVDRLSRKQATDHERATTSGRKGSRNDLLWALRQINAATDALHDAAKRDAEVRQLQRQALERQEEATAAVRRSDQLRSEALGVILSPEDPSQLLE